MITVIAAGIAFIVVVAIVVGIVDAAQAHVWRQVAADRRARWEAHRPEFHGVDPQDAWSDD